MGKSWRGMERDIVVVFGGIGVVDVGRMGLEVEEGFWE
jgi:hypothetical protein